MLNVNLSILSCYPSALVCVIDVLRNNDELQNSQNINIIMIVKMKKKEELSTHTTTVLVIPREILEFYWPATQ